MTQDAGLRKESDEVYFCTQTFPTVGRTEIEFLKARAKENWRLRCRLCLHQTVADPLQDMVLVFHNTTYFRPLRHTERAQLFHVLEGAMTLLVLDEHGRISNQIALAAEDATQPFETSLAPGIWYSFVLRTEWLVIRETTTGPMTATDREYAPFAPAEGDPAAHEYARELQRVADLQKPGR